MLLPTYIAKEQIEYPIHRGQPLFIFDIRRQRVYKESFNFHLTKLHDMTEFTDRNQSKVVTDEERVDYVFYNDQLIYDAQLGDYSFLEKEDVSQLTSTFIPYSQAKEEADEILFYHRFVKTFAERKFLIVFRGNINQPKPSHLYGFLIKDIRENKLDRFKWY